MEENSIQRVNSKDIMIHYISSVFIYGIILAIVIFCPVYNETIENEDFNYATFFLLYYVAYIIFAPAIFFIFKPKSISNSRNLSVFNYFKRQFDRKETTEERLKNIEPKEDEKQAFMILFVKSFFGVFCISQLCNNYLPSLGYNLDFLKVMFQQAQQYISSGAGFAAGVGQYFIDTGDMWLTLIFTITTLTLAISYLTETDIFKNKIKSVDTTPLGVISCIVCYYPITLLTDKFIRITENSLLPVDNPVILAGLNVAVILVNLISLIAILRLGTKAGNLTNRGIVTGFPYNIVRHPSYSMQIFYMILTTIPLYLISDYEFFDKIFISIALLAWIYIYYLRAVTEERHLIKDPKYKEYVEKVKYRFIPKVF